VRIRWTLTACSQSLRMCKTQVSGHCYRPPRSLPVENFSEAYVLPTAQLRPVRRHSAELPLCTKPMSGGNAEEMKLSSVLLASAVLGAALVATSEPAAAYHHGWRYEWHWGSTYPYSFGYNYPYSVTMAAAATAPVVTGRSVATAPVVTGRSVATGQEYYSVATGQEYDHFYPMMTAREGFTMRRERLSLARKGLSRPPPPIMWSSSGMVPNEHF
jgi:hypothetical protein